MPELSVKTVLGWALRIEANGEAFYREVAARAQDREVKLLFEDLANQEQRHYRTFERMLDRLPVANGASADPSEYEAYLRTALGNALFGGLDNGLVLARQAADEAAALRAAIAFEKDTLLFFHDLREMVPVAHREALTAIVQEESSHVRQLAKVLHAGPWVS
jgi:rubrerythrin